MFQGGWEVTKVETVAANKLRVTIFNENNTKSVLSAGARVNYIAAGEGENVIATLDYIQTRIIPVATNYVTAYNNLVAAGEAGRSLGRSSLIGSPSGLELADGVLTSVLAQSDLNGEESCDCSCHDPGCEGR